MHVRLGQVNLFPATTEMEIFEALGLEYVAPQKRNTDIKAIGAPAIEYRAPAAGGAADLEADDDED